MTTTRAEIDGSGGGASPPSPYSLAHLRHVPRRHTHRWVAAALILLAFGWVAHAFATGQIEWEIVAQFFTARAILLGLVNTVVMTVLAMAAGDRAGGGLRHHVHVPQPGPEVGGLGLHLVLPRHPVDAAAAAVVQPGAGVPDHRHPRAVRSPHRGRDHPVHGDAARAGDQPGGLHGRGRARRHPVGGHRPDRGGQGDRDGPAHHPAPDRAAAGHAGHHPPDRQRGHQHGEAHVGRERHPVLGDPAQRPGDLLRQRARDRAADRRGGLVPDRGDPAVGRAVFSRAAFCQGRRALPGCGSGRRPRGSAPYDGRPHGRRAGRPQVLRQPARPERGQPGGRARGGAVHHRALGVGQEHLSALHQPARAGRPGRHMDRPGAGRVPPRGGCALRADRRGRSRASGPRSGWCSSASTSSAT